VKLREKEKVRALRSNRHDLKPQKTSIREMMNWGTKVGKGFEKETKIERRGRRGLPLRHTPVTESWDMPQNEGNPPY